MACWLSRALGKSSLPARRAFATWVACATFAFGGSLAAGELYFERDVAPLLVTRCVECHNARQASGGLDLTTRAKALAGGDSGEVIVEHEPDSSYLLDRVAQGEMPPPIHGQPQQLASADVDKLRGWIAAGARWPADRKLDIYERTSAVRGGRDWWSFQPVHRPQPPKPNAADRVANPIDAFVVARLEGEHLSLAPLADRRTLVRRAYFDLWGLPPTPEQIAEFIHDDRPDAWEKLIDGLLASENYGQRWARYWLDVVRFAETCGYERDQIKPGIWRYRDWVIDSLNQDMPYDRFVTLQLAGDEVADRDVQSVVATGMIRAGTWNDEPNDPADYQYDRLEDMVHTTTSAFLGLTVKCARCHDHKFDPIRQTDYYRMAGFFWSGYIGQENLGGPTSAQLGVDAFGWTDRGPTADPLHLLVKGERLQPAEVVEPGFLSVVRELDRPVAPPPPAAKTTERRSQLAHWITDPRNPLAARVIVNRIWQHHFGQGLVRTPNNFGFKGDLPSHPELLDWLAAELIQPTIAVGSADKPGPAWTMKRLHKLIMLSSTYRQASQNSQEAAASSVDPLNRLLWHASRRRLDAEALRDAMLAVSGELNPAAGGPSFYPTMSSEALEGLSRKDNAWGNSPPEERARRSVYMMTQRSRLLPLMTAFDFPDTTLPCEQRDVTTVPTQALALLNNDFVHSQSDALATRVAKEAGADVAKQIERAWQLTLGRAPDAQEQSLANAHLTEQVAYYREHESHEPAVHVIGQSESVERAAHAEHMALASLCHVLLNANEFIYVD